MEVDHRKGPRRRGEALEEAILRAAIEELTEVGYTAVSMERIAIRARTSKAALYRRWSGRPDLIIDAYFKFAAAELDVPDTGSLRTDVIALLRRTADRATAGMLHFVFGVIADAGANEELKTKIRERLALMKPKQMHGILQRAEARGEARGDLPERLRTLPLDLIRNEILQHVGGPNVPDSVIEEIVDLVFLPLVRP
ncbi:TetR/AcrR family transcriptional regulator [Kibdelosporangium philippinense]|uniref:TetR/AcrR family transcriptional regulator n=1 Tax=Kibdelosporangium philippinense TaxID=211113 RepID=A0ABS8ZRS4_9PSEU|nr:TetR/AcrR family transcriptional regulator [Kibdelosporangium philippinense]MCE7008517.1 TetR/AcrR family transcriptional regulator [Kibdelosporangium philippinense]